MCKKLKSQGHGGSVKSKKSQIDNENNIDFSNSKINFMSMNVDEDFIETYDIIASRRGALTKGGVADYDRVSEIIIRDLKNGYFENITFKPSSFVIL